MACIITIDDVLGGDADNVLTIQRDQAKSTLVMTTNSFAFRHIGNAFLKAAGFAGQDGNASGGYSLGEELQSILAQN